VSTPGLICEKYNKKHCHYDWTFFTRALRGLGYLFLVTSVDTTVLKNNNSVLNKIKLSESTRLNKYHDIGLHGLGVHPYLPYPTNMKMCYGPYIGYCCCRGFWKVRITGVNETFVTHIVIGHTR
jgi:hypothetical protein